MTTIAARLRIGPGATATRHERLAYRLLLPVFGTVVVVATIPFVLAVIESVTRGGEFVGLANYVRALSNPALAESVRQTAIYGLIVVPSEILLGTGPCPARPQDDPLGSRQGGDLRPGHHPDRHPAVSRLA